MKKSKSSYTIVSELFTKLFASEVIVISMLVLIGWYAGLMFLTKFSISEVPIAPSIACVFIFLGINLHFYFRPQEITINRIALLFLISNRNIFNIFFVKSW